MKVPAIAAVLLLSTARQQKVASQIAPREVTVAFAKPARLARTDTAGLAPTAMFIDSVVFLRGRIAREVRDTVVVQVLSGQRRGAADWEGGYVAVARGPDVTFDLAKAVTGPDKKPGPHASLTIVIVAVPMILMLAVLLLS